MDMQQPTGSRWTNRQDAGAPYNAIIPLNAGAPYNAIIPLNAGAP
jgi:hypothetical protein